MARQLSLPTRFPDSPFLVRAKYWTPDRGTMEVEGPYDEVPGELLMMVSVHGHATGKKLAAMKRCLKALQEKN